MRCARLHFSRVIRMIRSMTKVQEVGSNKPVPERNMQGTVRARAESLHGQIACMVSALSETGMRPCELFGCTRNSAWSSARKMTLSAYTWPNKIARSLLSVPGAITGRALADRRPSDGCPLQVFDIMIMPRMPIACPHNHTDSRSAAPFASR